MKKLHASGEDYLEAILVLQKQKGMVRSVDVARHLEVTKPSVCNAVATLRDGGFLSVKVSTGSAQIKKSMRKQPCQPRSFQGKGQNGRIYQAELSTVSP